MTSSLGSASIQLVSAAIPGLVQFGAGPLRLTPMFQAEKIRLYIPDREILNLDRLTITGPGQDALARAACVMSSSHASSGAPAGLLTGRPIHTERQEFPFWELTFDSPQVIQEMEVGNRLGLWSSRSHGLCVDLYGAGGDVWRFSNTSSNVLTMRLGEFQGRVRELDDVLRELPVALKLKIAPLRAEMMRGVSQLVRMVELVLGSAEISPELARQTRVKLLGALAAMPAAVPPAVSRDLVRLSGRVIDWLLERTARAKSEPDENELMALAVLFAARFLVKKKVELPLVRDNEAFLGDTAATRSVEERVNQLYKGTGSDAAALPIMFRSHGMSGAELRLNADKFVASMKEVEAAFAELGYECAICYGTLLGAVRTGEFIPHDDDVDMVIPLKGVGGSTRAELKEIAECLTEKKVTVRLVEAFDFLKVKAPIGGRYVDVFPIIPKERGRALMYMQEMRTREVPGSMVLPFGKMVFYGEEFKRPANTDDFLADRYGDDWRVPKRLIGSKMMEV